MDKTAKNVRNALRYSVNSQNVNSQSVNSHKKTRALRRALPSVFLFQVCSGKTRWNACQTFVVGKKVERSVDKGKKERKREKREACEARRARERKEGRNGGTEVRRGERAERGLK